MKAHCLFGCRQWLLVAQKMTVAGDDVRRRMAKANEELAAARSELADVRNELEAERRHASKDISAASDLTTQLHTTQQSLQQANEALTEAKTQADKALQQVAIFQQQANDQHDKCERLQSELSHAQGQISELDARYAVQAKHQQAALVAAEEDAKFLRQQLQAAQTHAKELSAAQTGLQAEVEAACNELKTSKVPQKIVRRLAVVHI